MFTATITDFPLSDDPTQSVVQATLVDDASGQTIVRNYTLPVVNNPQPTDFQTLIQADVDALNTATTQANSLATQFSQTINLAIPLSSELQASLSATPVTPVSPAQPEEVI